jgi:hypothetical protein
MLTECILGEKRMAIMSSSSIGRLITLAWWSWFWEINIACT